MIQDSIQKTIDGLHGICAEIQILENRISQLENERQINNYFFDELETLLKERKTHLNGSVY